MSRRPPFQPIDFGNHLKDTGNYRIANGEIFQWTGTHWMALNTRQIEHIALKWIHDGDHAIASSTNAKSACATALIWLGVLEEPKQVPVVPVLNGYIHIEKCGVTLKPHDKELALRHVISCDYNPTATPPTEFNKFLESVLPDLAVRERVQEYIGYTLLPDASHQIAQFWLGNGANGKGVLSNILQALHRKTAAVNLDSLEGFNLTEVLNASLIYCDEAPPKMKSTLFKMGTASESTQINRRYKDPITAKILGKWLILGNYIPEITDYSNGFWRRLDIVPFEVTVGLADRDPLLAKRIISRELAGVLKWAIDGVIRLNARGKFDPILPPPMARARQMALAESDPIRTWTCDNAIVLQVTCDTLKANVYSNYANWCRANGCSVDSSVKFWKRFSTLFSGLQESRMQTYEGYRRTCNVKV